MEDKIIECLNLQDRLNNQINPHWKKERSQEEFYRAIWIECAEAMESLPWKWWKKMELDFENLEIEIADIFHFILSISLMNSDRELLYFKKALASDFHNLSSIEGDYINHYLANIYTKEKIEGYLFLIERVAEKALRQDYNGTLFFFGLLVKDTIGFDRLHLLYFGKNILNRFRQEMGYKSGNYQKVIGGIEDNRYLVRLIKNIDNIEKLEKELRDILTTSKGGKV